MKNLKCFLFNPSACLRTSIYSFNKDFLYKAGGIEGGRETDTREDKVISKEQSVLGRGIDKGKDEAIDIGDIGKRPEIAKETVERSKREARGIRARSEQLTTMGLKRQAFAKEEKDFPNLHKIDFGKDKVAEGYTNLLHNEEKDKIVQDQFVGQMIVLTNLLTEKNSSFYSTPKNIQTFFINTNTSKEHLRSGSYMVGFSTSSYKTPKAKL